MSPYDPRLTLIATQARVKTCHVFHCWSAMRAMGKQFHVKAFAAFAGLEARHVESIIEALGAHEALPAKRSGSDTRGRRLPADFTMPQEWLDWAIKERRWSPTETQQEADNFIDFWHAKGGANAVKLDWRKTWQNWVRNSRRPDGDFVQAKTVDPNDLLAKYEAKVKWAREQGLPMIAREYEAKAAAIRNDNVVQLRRAEK